MTIWIDADSCPSMVRNYVVKYSTKLNLNVKFVANKQILIQEKGNYEFIVCDDTKDAADNYIYENCISSDLVVTRDIVFANRLVEKNILTINDRGTVFTSENIRELLSERDFTFEMAQIGLVKHYHEGYDKKKFSQFANCFDREIHRLLKANPQ